MPTYNYRCEQCDVFESQIMSIAGMESIERQGGPWHACPGRGSNLSKMAREYGRGATYHAFKEGWFEHVGPNPVYCSTMQQLADVTRKNGLYSEYVENSNGTRRVQHGRWI